uniref:histidine kinase n=1 Tax=Fervidobacterium thailandense TaxID=1008305 RepID=A0A7C5RIX6_9BACT
MKLRTKISVFNTIASVTIVLGVFFVIYQFFCVSVNRSIKNELADAERAVTIIKTPFGVQYIVRRWDLYVALMSDQTILNDPYGIGYVDSEGLQKIGNRYVYFSKFGDLVFGKDVTPSVRFLNLLKLLFTVSLLALGLAIFISNYVISQRSVNDLKEFVTQLEQLGGKDVTFRVRIEPKSDEVKELINKFNDLMDRIERTYKSQESFVAAVSHELRTPVANLIGYVNMLKRWGTKNQEILAESITAIEESSREIKDIIENMLLIAKVETLTKERLSLRELVEDIVRQKFKDSNIEVEGFGSLEANKEGLSIIISILVDNAIKHGKPPIRVVLSDNKIDVINHGDMIPEKDIPKIFEMFYKGKNSEGTGLGLYIANEIAKKIGLNISVSSTQERTIFSVHN